MDDPRASFDHMIRTDDPNGDPRASFDHMIRTDDPNGVYREDRLAAIIAEVSPNS
jgi:hypothetical protein